MKTLQDSNLKDKNVIIRADLNVPLNSGEVEDATRIEAVIPTIKLILDKEPAKITICSHLGRPTSENKEQFSLKPVAKKLEELLGKDIIMAQDCAGEDSTKKFAELEPGQILLLENTRFEEGESSNDEAFAKRLAAFGEVFINDAFATAHRSHASNVGITEFVSESYLGLLFEKEVSSLSSALKNPNRPLLAIVGGAKITTKIKLIESFAGVVDKIIIGGAMANTFAAAKGYNVGKSLFEEDQIELAKSLIQDLGEKLVLPSDFLVANEFSPEATTKNVADSEISDQDIAVDIGEKSISNFSQVIENAGTIIWNGPMGAFEIKKFSKGTFDVAKAVAESTAFSIVGGGDTDLALEQSGYLEQISYVSTAGGAFLKYLEDGKLPALNAIEKA